MRQPFGNAQTRRTQRALRVLYAAGPGDVAGTFQYWKKGLDDPRQVAGTYSAQFFSLCQELGAHAYVLSSSRSPGKVDEEQITIRHRPIPFSEGWGSLLYHLGQIWAALSVVMRAVLFRADVVVVNRSAGHMFPLSLLALFRIKAILTLHTLLWHKYHSQQGIRKWITKLDAFFYSRVASVIMCASQEGRQQIETITRGHHGPILEFLPTYRRATFEGIPAPPAQRQPFRVLFAGRIERTKGVFDVLSIAQRFAAEGRREIGFDLCGDGSALEELKRKAAEAGLSETFRCHGHCTREQMRDMFSQAHLLIVPTTTELAEGFNQVVVEGVLSGRVVITSNVCPSVEYVRTAVVEVPPNDVKAYGDAILQLHDDESLYQAKCAACTKVQSQFYDLDRSWQMALKQAMDHLFSEPNANGAGEHLPDSHSAVAGVPGQQPLRREADER